MNYLFEWTTSISVNEKNIDMQHKRLLHQVNILLSAVVNNSGDEIITEAIDFLDSYINEHLMYEEKYMIENNYPDIEKHVTMHHDFIIHYKDFKNKFIAGVSKDKLALEIEQYIGNWWIEHIGKMDKQYALYIESKK
ncbi:MAG: hemerythrin family protein [Candidatus Paceibacterota bacterium]|jgi:hemerythrin